MMFFILWELALWELEKRCEQRIACDELGYPYCEACYASVDHWERMTGYSWVAFLNGEVML
jgi:hypothetical protein